MIDWRFHLFFVLRRAVSALRTGLARIGSWIYRRLYLKSRHWRIKRAATMARVQNMCERCEKRAAVDVHHRTYARLGREVGADLQALCRQCHVKEHANEWEKK